MLLLHAAGDEDHRRHRHDEQEHRRAQHFVYAQGVQGAPQGRAAHDGGHRPGDLPGVEGHKAVIARAVLAEGSLHAAPQQGVHVHMEHVAELQQRIHLREAGGGLPLRYGLPAHIQPLGQLLLGDALPGAEVL